MPVVQNDRQYHQLQSNVDKNCVGMVFLKPWRNPAWILIPCFTKIKDATFLCETDIAKTYHLSINVSCITICPKYWFVDQFRCIYVELFLQGRDLFRKSRNICSFHGGNIINVPTKARDLYSRDYNVRHGLRYWEKDNYICTMTHLELPLHSLKHWQLSRQDTLFLINLIPNSTGQSYLFTSPRFELIALLMLRFFCLRKHEPTLVFSTKNRSHVDQIQRGVICARDSDMLPMACAVGQFACDYYECILEHYVCDGVADCVNKTDEDRCEGVCSSSSGSRISPQICFKICRASDCSCSSLYFHCHTGSCIPFSKVQDGNGDCPDFSDEDYISLEKKRITLIGEVHEVPKYNIFHGKAFCNNPNYIPCDDFTGEECYNRAHICVLDFDNSGRQRYCSSGKHLSYCADFTCASMFKCPLSYCIPIRYICDGILNCYGGQDEASCKYYSCPYYLRCKLYTCIHINEVCDGQIHCRIYLDDEYMCDVKECPIFCSCKGLALECNGAYVTTLPFLSYHVRSITLQNGRINTWRRIHGSYDSIFTLNLASNQIYKLEKNSMKAFMPLRELYLDNNYIFVLGAFIISQLCHLRCFSILRNPLNIIMPNSFSNLAELPSLHLGGLEMRELTFNIFYGLLGLCKLNLSFNKIHKIHEKVFKTNRKLHSLNLEGNKLETFNEKWISGLEHLELFHSDFFQLCCLATDLVHCFPAPIDSSTCLRILHTKLHVLIVYMIILHCLLIVLAKVAIRQGNRLYSVHKYTVQDGIFLVDQLTTIQFCIVVTGDAYYGKAYIMFDIMWRTTTMCQYIPTVSLFLNVTSTVLLAGVYARRYISIVFAFKFPTRRDTLMYFITFFSCIAALSFVVASNFSYSPVRFFTPLSPLCVPGILLPISDIAYGFRSCFLLLHTTMFLFAAVSHVLILWAVMQTRRRAMKNSSGVSRTLIMNVVFIVIGRAFILSFFLIGVLFWDYRWVTQRQSEFILLTALYVQSFINGWVELHNTKLERN